MLSQLAMVLLWGIGERVVGPVHQRVLAEHRRHCLSMGLESVTLRDSPAGGS